MKVLFDKKTAVYKYIYNIFLSVMISLSSIFIFTFILLKCSFIYDIFCRENNLAESLGISQTALHKNYIMITDFVSSPFKKSLNLPNFNISYTAMIHFNDVKNIFKSLALIFVLTSFILILQFIIRTLMKKDLSLKFLCYLPKELLSFIAILAVSFAVNFNRAFIFFHKLLFRNDYWLFDPKIDTVINMLPEKFFFIAAVIILCCLLLESITLMLINIKFHSHICSHHINVIYK